MFKHFSFPELSIPQFRSFTPGIQNFIRKYGNEKIEHVKIARKPISDTIKSAMNVLSLGQLSKNLKEAGYDKIFHLYLLVWTALGELKIYKLEKNQTIELTPAHETDLHYPGVEIYDVGPVNVTWADFFRKGEETAKSMGKDFFVYDARTDNCQFFVQEMMRGINKWNANTEKFVMQDPMLILKNLGWLGSFAKGLTNIAGYATNIFSRFKNLFSR